MTSLQITLNDIIEKANALVEEFQQPQIFRYCFATAYHNILAGKKSAGDPPCLFHSLMCDEIEFCELSKIKGLEFLAEEMPEECDYFEWYTDTEISKIAYDALLLAIYVSGQYDINYFFNPEAIGHRLDIVEVAERCDNFAKLIVGHAGYIAELGDYSQEEWTFGTCLTEYYDSRILSEK